MSDALQRARHHNLGRLLHEVSSAYSVRALVLLQQRGFPELRAPLQAALINLGLEGARLTELADRAGITKQAMGSAVDELVAQGLLERVPDPDDGRAKRIVFTARGKHALEVGVQALDDVEREFVELVGTDHVVALRAGCAALVQALPVELPR